jgi:hypothetical protein
LQLQEILIEIEADGRLKIWSLRPKTLYYDVALFGPIACTAFQCVLLSEDCTSRICRPEKSQRIDRRYNRLAHIQGEQLTKGTESTVLKQAGQKSTLSSLGHHAIRHTSVEATSVERLERAFLTSRLPVSQRLANFPRHVRRQDIARFLVRYELFKLSLPANGSIVECGVFAGGGLASWLHFSACMEPYNHSRRVIGFDTFTGFPNVHEQDAQHGESEHLSVGAFETHDSIQEEIMELMAIHDSNRPLGHLPKVELVAGDATETIPEYLTKAPHLLISLLYLDFDLYQPTKAALAHLLPRVVKGGIVAFDELNCAEFPGETVALMETLDLAGVQLQRSPIDPYISYFVR